MENKIPHILIVDDDPSLLITMSDILKVKGFEPITAQTGKMAVAHLENYNFSLALVDLHLEDMSGLDVVRVIKVRSPETECVLLTGQASQNSAIEALQMGVYGYFQKPFDMEQVLLSIQRVVEKHAIAAALRESEDRYRTLVESSPDSICIHCEGKVVYVNHAALELFHASRLEDMIGMPIIQFVHPDHRDNVTNRSWLDYENHLQTHSLEEKFITLDGQPIDVEVIGTPTVHEGKPATQTIIRDITQRKQAEKALRTSEEHYRAVTQTASDAIISADSAGNIVSWNHSAKLMFGYTEAEVMGQPLTLILPDRYHESHLIEMTRVRTGGEKHIIGKAIEVEGLRKYGSEFPLELSLSEWQVENNKFYTAIIRDITERKQSEEQLRKLSRAVDQSPASVVITDLKGQIEYVNPKFSNVTGYRFDEVFGKNTRILKSGHTTQEEYKKLWDTITSGNVWQGELLNIKKNGENYWELAIIAPVFSIEGEITNFLALNEDITERKQAEAALAQSEQAYRTLFDNAPIGLYRTSAEGLILDANPSLVKMFGYENRESLLGKNIVDFYIDPANDEKFRNEMEKDNNLYNFVAEYRHRDGTTFWTEDYTHAVRNDVGAILFYEGSLIDITERKLAEQVAYEQQQVFRTLVENSPDIIARYDHDCRRIYINPAYVKTAQISQQELLFKSPAELSPMPTTSALILQNLIRKVFAGGVAESIDVAWPKADDNEYWYNIYASPEFDREERVVSVMTVSRDITERKRAEEAIHQRVRELELLYESGLVFSQLLNPKEIAQKIIELLEEKLNWHHTTIRLASAKDEESLELLAFSKYGLGNAAGEDLVDKAHLSKLVSKSGEGLSGWAFKHAKIVRTGNVNTDPHYIETYQGIQSGLYVPLRSGNRTIGVVSLESKEPNAFSEADEHLITTLASQAAIAFENAHLYEKTLHHAEELEQHVRERTAEIESTRQRLELAVKTAGIGIWELDIKQNQEFWDDRLFTLYGLSKESTQPSPETWQSVIHPDDLAHQLKLIDQSLYHDQPYDTEFRVVLPDASIRYIKSNGILIRDVAGTPERMIGANHDITIHKQAEETLRLANGEMERNIRMKNEFLANMSHELRTPLNAILGISESLEEQISGSLNEKQLKYIRVINESGRHLLELINDILDLSKIEAGKLELHIQPITVEKFCDSSLRMVKELAHKKSLDVIYKPNEKVRVILGDERRLKQALVNLLGNAVKFTPEGQKIGLDVTSDPEKNEVIFTVWDEGIGIEQEDIHLLFKPFVQLSAGLTREYAGTGLGLALVEQMVLMHGGRMELESKPKEGSRFRMILPWLPTEQMIQPPTKPQVAAYNPKSSGKRTGKILVVDDTEVVAQLVSDYLKSMGYETLIAYDGGEAVSVAKKEHPQIILMDVMMPIMDGLEATRKIRADVSLRDIPVIGLTALAMPSDREQCLAVGMNDHLSKPIQMQELVRIIERYLQKEKP
jgi:PAS domain S-box-containing protein